MNFQEFVSRDWIAWEETEETSRKGGLMGQVMEGTVAWQDGMTFTATAGSGAISDALLLRHGDAARGRADRRILPLDRRGAGGGNRVG
jgi:hypothetical protein